MPNRVLRDWTDSERVDCLSVHAERFFTRLIMKVDDYGRYSANVKLLKSTLFPLRTDVREPDISRFLSECKEAGLIALYNIASKDFLQIEDFRQTLRQKTEKYPPPIICEADAQQMRSRCTADANTKGIEVESEEEVEKKLIPIGISSASPPAKARSIPVFKTDNREEAKKWFEFYETLPKDQDSMTIQIVKKSIKEWIESNETKCIEAYLTAFNLFRLKFKNIPQVESISVDRRKKFKLRIENQDFNFYLILSKISASEYLRGDSTKWKVTWDWIFENDSNFRKIQEDNYR